MKISGTNQLWIAEINFVRLKNEFIYCAVVPVGRALDRRSNQNSASTAVVVPHDKSH